MHRRLHLMLVLILLILGMIQFKEWDRHSCLSAWN